MLRLARALALIALLTAQIGEWRSVRQAFRDYDAVRLAWLLYLIFMCVCWSVVVVQPVHRVCTILYRWLLFQLVALMLILSSLTGWKLVDLSRLSWSENLLAMAVFAAALVEGVALVVGFAAVERARTEARQAR